MSAISPGLSKIIKKVRISRYFQSTETDLYRSENACSINYANTWSSKWVHWVSKSQSAHRGTTCYRCEDMLELDTGVAWASLPITRIRPPVAPTSKIQWLPASLHNTAWIDHCQVRHGSFEAIPILDTGDIEQAYSHIASRYHCLQWHVWSYGWHYASCG